MIHSRKLSTKALIVRTPKATSIEELRRLFQGVRLEEVGFELNPDEWEELTLGDVRLLDSLVDRLCKLVEQREENDRIMDEQSDPSNYD